MTRPSDITRERIIKAAQRLFANHGYKDTSVRAVVTRARVNQAAINYHFGGKYNLANMVWDVRQLPVHGFNYGVAFVPDINNAGQVMFGKLVYRAKQTGPAFFPKRNHFYFV